MRASRRSLQMLSTTMVLGSLAIAGCKDAHDPDQGNRPPAADFTSACTDLSCSFTDLSSDDAQLSAFHWEFGDGAVSTGRNPVHAYSGGGSFSVTLAVTDNDGATGSVTKAVSVAPAEAGAPTAAFQVNCASLECTFTDASTDTNGTVVGWAWEFGDGDTSAEQNPPTHIYAVATRTIFSARLTVTDNDGLTSVASAQITVSPPASLQCEDAAGTGHFNSCDLVLESNATVSVKLVGRSCDAHGDTFRVTAPVSETLFSDGCYPPPAGPALNQVWNLNGGNPFAAGDHLRAEMISGAINQQLAPAIHVSGAYPTWTLKFDDGVGGATEPDFDDLVMTVTAHPVP